MSTVDDNGVRPGIPVLLAGTDMFLGWCDVYPPDTNVLDIVYMIDLSEDEKIEPKYTYVKVEFDPKRGVYTTMDLRCFECAGFEGLHDARPN